MVQLDVQLQLPRDARSVPVARDVAGTLLSRVAAPTDAIDDVTLALGEACANAVLHASGVESYSVRVAVDGGSCAVDVEDLGPGGAEGAPEDGAVGVRDSRTNAARVETVRGAAEDGVLRAAEEAIEAAGAQPSASFDEPAETGRGLALMRALVDDLHVERGAGATRVRMVKRWERAPAGVAGLGAAGPSVRAAAAPVRARSAPLRASGSPVSPAGEGAVPPSAPRHPHAR